MDAILEYTGMGNFPRIFGEDGVPAANVPYLKLKQNDLENHRNPSDLPQRMEDNRLHRFSKVLETNIGADQTSTTRILPQCRQLQGSKAQPLNRTAPTNLYRAQKLMSLSANIDLESLMISNKQKPKQNLEDELVHEVDDWMGNMANFASMENDEGYPLYSSRSYHLSNQMLFWIFCFLCVLCYMGYKCYRKRRKFFLRRQLRHVNIKSMSSHFFMNNKSTASPGKTHHRSMSPPTSPRTVFVDKISSRRKVEDAKIFTAQTISSSDKTIETDLVKFPNDENSSFTQNNRSNDAYKRFV